MVRLALGASLIIIHRCTLPRTVALRSQASAGQVHNMLEVQDHDKRYHDERLALEFQSSSSGHWMSHGGPSHVPASLDSQLGCQHSQGTWSYPHDPDSHSPPPRAHKGPGSEQVHHWIWQCHCTSQQDMDRWSIRVGRSGCRCQARTGAPTYQHTCEIHMHCLLLQLLAGTIDTVVGTVDAHEAVIQDVIIIRD